VASGPGEPEFEVRQQGEWGKRSAAPFGGPLVHQDLWYGIGVCTAQEIVPGITLTDSPVLCCVVRFSVIIVPEVKAVVSIELPKEEIRSFCRRRGIRKLALFGSVLRPDFNPDSDIDVLVEFDSATHVGFFELYEIEQELSRLIGGRKVDLNTPNSLSEYFRQQVLAEAQVQYVAT
jgi:hypothetical protein